MKWIERNLKTIIYIAFLVPIITVAVVSISHVSAWYGLSNPASWALYLSVGIEIAALSSLAAISVQMGNKVYFPFGIVTLIQFIGNIFFAYQYIEIDSKVFLDWVDLVDPIVIFLGIEADNLIAHKRFLALFSGGMLPIISLSFLHMLVKFEEEEKKKRESNNNENVNDNTNLNIDEIKDSFNFEELSTQVGKEEYEIEKDKITPSESDLDKLQVELEKIINKKFGDIDDKINQNIFESKNVETNENPSNDEVDTELEVPDKNIDENSENNFELSDEDQPKIKRLNYLKRND